MKGKNRDIRKTHITEKIQRDYTVLLFGFDSQTDIRNHKSQL